MTAITRNPLPHDRSFKELAPAFVGPYLIFVAIATIPQSWLPVAVAQVAKCLLTGGALLLFRRHYRLGPFNGQVLLAAVACLPIALLAWIGPLYLLSAGGLLDLTSLSSTTPARPLYFWLRVFNSVVLVALFEELFTRAYLLGWFHQAGRQRPGKGIVDAILDTLDQTPEISTRLPISAFSVLLATLVFAGGHQPREYLSAVAYFTLTTWLYHRTGSLWACVCVHGFTNLVIAFLARYGGMAFLW
ncbi:MAG: CPBP family glutamic-type intramembrane protease [Desulfosarcinaceae bacterium]|nr:CPBP family glutamic-type intramembrane protease [Desulfosarcinaceae bacterium]